MLCWCYINFQGYDYACTSDKWFKRMHCYLSFFIKAKIRIIQSVKLLVMSWELHVVFTLIVGSTDLSSSNGFKNLKSKNHYRITFFTTCLLIISAVIILTYNSMLQRCKYAQRYTWFILILYKWCNPAILFSYKRSRTHRVRDGANSSYHFCNKCIDGGLLLNHFL